MEKNQSHEEHQQFAAELPFAQSAIGSTVEYSSAEQVLLNTAYADMFLRDSQRDYQEEEQKKPQSFGGCSNPVETLDWLEELNKSSERTGKNIKSMAIEAATDAVSAKLEFLLGRTLFHVQYEKKENGRWENSGRDLVELFDPSKPGGERRERYEKLKKEMDGAKVGMVFSEPTVFDNVNYVQVFVDTGSTIEEYVVQFQGSHEEFARIYRTFSETADNSSEITDVDYTTPLRFTQDVPLDEFVHTIESSYSTEESKQQAGEYLERLTYDMAHLSEIDAYQKEAQRLAEYLEQQMLSQGISHGILTVLAGELDAYAKGSETVDTLVNEKNRSLQQEFGYISTIAEYIAEAAVDVQQSYPEYSLQDVSKSFDYVFDLLDGEKSEEALFALSTPPANIESQVSMEALWVQKAVETLSITESEASLLRISISKIHELFESQFENLHIVETMDVGFGAIYFAIDTMLTADVLKQPEHQVSTKESDVPIVASLVEQQLIETVEERETVLPQKHKELIFSFFDSGDIKYAEEELLMSDGIDVTTIKELVAFIKKIDTFQPQLQKESIQKEKQITGEKMENIWEMITILRDAPLLTDSARHPSEVVSITIMSKEHKLEENENQFSFAVSLWMLFTFMNYFSSLEVLEHMVEKKTQNESILDRIKKEKPEELIQKEPVSWLLFAIIWHLAMIREQGFAQSSATSNSSSQPLTKKKKKHKGSINIYHDTSFASGVIYAFKNVMIDV